MVQNVHLTTTRLVRLDADVVDSKTYEVLLGGDATSDYFGLSVQHLKGSFASVG